MKRIIIVLIALLSTILVSAQSLLSFGARGGLDFLMPKSDQTINSKAGFAGNFDVGYTYYWYTVYSGDWGIHTGASFGYAQNRSDIVFSQQYTNYDYPENEMLYTTSGVVDVEMRRMYVEVPLMAAFRYHGFVAQLGMKAQCAVWSRASQDLSQLVIDAYYVPYDVHVIDELITGVVAEEDLQKTYSNIAPRINLLVGGRIGYESSVGSSGKLGIMAYVDYNVWNNLSFTSTTQPPLIAVSPISNPLNPVPPVTVNSAFGSLVSRINPLQVGVTLYYGIEFKSSPSSRHYHRRFR